MRPPRQIVYCPIELFAPKGIVAGNDAPVRTKERLPLEAAPVGEVPQRVHPRERPPLEADCRVARKPASASTSAKTTCRGTLRLRPRARLLHLDRWLCPAPGPPMRERGSGGQLRRRARHRFARCLREWDHQRRIPAGRRFDLLAGYASARREFSMVVLDPPAFTKSRRASRTRPAVTKRSTCAPCACSSRRHSGHLLLLPPRE